MVSRSGYRLRRVGRGNGVGELKGGQLRGGGEGEGGERREEGIGFCFGGVQWCCMIGSFVASFSTVLDQSFFGRS
jgi:hypothetical protein